MIRLDSEPIVEKIIHRLVRKHIAGTTMDSGLDAARALNGRGMPASLTFLSSGATDRAKAKYVTSTYCELVRRIARSGINGGVHVQMDQIGSLVDEGVAMENFREIVGVGNRHGIFIWADAGQMLKRMAPEVEAMRGVGIVAGEDGIEYCAKRLGRGCALKIAFGNSADKAAVAREIDALRGRLGSVVLLSLPDKSIPYAVKAAGKPGASVEFEFGCGEKRIKSAAKKGAKVSVLVPFGKDWIRYAMSSAPEGYMRFIAARLLREANADEI